ncbi:heme-binding protein [Mycolicibacter arupensis]|jgi:hemophore-related protein|uniref:Hemophore-related protein n=1 Tax=Mycolicibacter arupensis TaxID=342002 RepID=A0A5C7XIY2_9MYCO|nr:heme-binding protein [Mycolicibacter arupensis]TXI49340.1 MAG: hemophore-related protein [Mycolicibacter arupensis]
MRTTTTSRLALGAATVGILGAVAAAATAGLTSPADAAPDSCSAAGLASTASGVLSQAGGFLHDHPETDQVLTSAASMPPDQAKSTVQGYFIGHLDQLSTLQGIAQPLTDLKNQCGIAVSPTQLATLLETVSK